MSNSAKSIVTSSNELYENTEDSQAGEGRNGNCPNNLDDRALNSVDGSLLTVRNISRKRDWRDR